MTPAHADVQLFDDVLDHEDRRPAAFLPGALDAAATHAAVLHAEMLLVALANSEGARGIDDKDEHAEHVSGLQRVEAKLDLLLGLFGMLLRERGHLPPPARLRWSPRGACIELLGDVLAVRPGAAGVLRVQPAEWLPDCIDLPARVIAADATHVWLEFASLPPALAEALERHLFRLHRRQVAEARRQR
ncbi:MAG TPA: PilZ domain-containing protein [Lysobacter sp.]